MFPLDLADIVGGNSVLNSLFIVLSVAGLLGLVLLLLSLLMDKLDAGHGPWGFCNSFAGVGLCGVIGGYVGWGLYLQSGRFFGSLAGISVGIGIVYLVLKFLEY